MELRKKKSSGWWSCLQNQEGLISRKYMMPECVFPAFLLCLTKRIAAVAFHSLHKENYHMVMKINIVAYSKILLF